MTDRELLELAAKAAGIRLEWDGHPDKWQPMYYEGKTYHSWEPLTDDEEALRLAEKLCIIVGWRERMQYAVASWDHGSLNQPVGPGETPESANRRATVRAAAEIGRSQNAPRT